MKHVCKRVGYPLFDYSLCGRKSDTKNNSWDKVNCESCIKMQPKNLSNFYPQNGGTSSTNISKPTPQKPEGEHE